MWYAPTYEPVAPHCDYCLGDFRDKPPMYVRGYAGYPVHRPDDKDSNDCAYWHDWQEFGRWETKRGMQGGRKWPDGREWNPEPWTEKPENAYCDNCKKYVSLFQKMYCFLCSVCDIVLINR